MFSKLVTVALSFLTLTATTTALTTPLHSRQSSGLNATLTQYLSSPNCDSTVGTIQVSTISINQCVNTGSQGNDASIGFSNLQGALGATICYGQAYEFAGCGTNAGEPTDGSFWKQRIVGANVGGSGDVCFEKVIWSDGQSSLGSVMLVCDIGL